MTTVATAIPIQLPGRQSNVRFTLNGAGSNFVRVWCTAAPPDSALAKQLASKSSSRVQVYEGPGGAEYPWRYTFDKGGVYTLQAQEYLKSGGWGGGHEGDPRGAPSEAKIGTEATLSLSIAQRATQKVGAGEDTATLVVYVVNDTVVQTFAAIHGETTPALTDPASEIARTACGTTAVVNAVASFVGYTTSSLIGGLSFRFNEQVDAFNAHGKNTGGAYHDTADNQDDLANNYGNPSTNEALAAAINKLRLRFSQHITNSKENDSSHPEYALPGGLQIHNQFDQFNRLIPITASAAAPETIYAAFGDYMRTYEAHRQQTTVHNSADSTNVIPTVTNPLLVLHREFARVLAALQPTAPTGQSTLVAQLISSAGFVEG